MLWPFYHLREFQCEESGFNWSITRLGDRSSSVLGSLAMLVAPSISIYHISRVLVTAASSPPGAMESVDFSFPRQDSPALEQDRRLPDAAPAPRRVRRAAVRDRIAALWTHPRRDDQGHRQSALGFHVTRRFGWDCHGLPVEHEVDGLLGIKRREDVIQGMGIAEYNEQCRSIVMRYSREWEKTVVRMGRWIDFQKDYKTMDPEFMESVFKQLFDKGLVYRGFKVMPYSTACTTALSNFKTTRLVDEDLGHLH